MEKKIIQMTLSDAIDTILRKEQVGFRPGVGRIGHIEQCIEWNTWILINFINSEKAFGSIPRNTLWNIVLWVPRKDCQHHQNVSTTIYLVVLSMRN